jgi:D-alanine-D-alanine ligase
VTSSPLSVVVLHEAIGPDARPDEADALVQAAQVSEAMNRLGWRVSSLATGLDLESTLASIRGTNPACVFNLVEALGGDGRMIHFVPGMLHAAGVSYTGSGSDAIYLSSHKLLAKKFMRLHEIPTPAWFAPGDARIDDSEIWIVKSVWEHASFGMDDGCVVKGTESARVRMAESEARLGGDWFAEQFVDGREFNISVLEQDGQPYILPLAEMTFVDYPQGKPRIVGYAAKWDESAPEYRATRREFPELAEHERIRLREIVHKCWTAFGLRGYARIDVRFDSAGRPQVLEINANPCLARDAGFVAAASEAGIPYQKLIERIVHAARRPALLVYRRTG